MKQLNLRGGVRRQDFSRGDATAQRKTSNVAPLRRRVRILRLARDSRPALVAITLIVLLAVFSIARQAPPATDPANKQANEFSAARAMRHLEVIAREPRPMGSSTIAEVRQYLLGELNRMQLAPEEQVSDVGTHNIVARLKGAGSGKAVMLVGHYDSARVSPGASDDGAAVVAILETLRALQAGPQLRNDVIALFTDGEEAGLIGSNAFVRTPVIKDVDIVLNFEARGTRGPVLMFETSHNNAWLIKEYARSSQAPFANSFMSVAYKLLPNDTDFTMFKEAGLAGLNFAFIDGYASYHTQFDNLQNLDLMTLQHEGDTALSLTRQLGNDDITEAAAEGDRVYFDIVGRFLLHYPARWATPLALVAALIFITVTAFGIKRKRITFSGVLTGSLAVLVCMVSSALIVALSWTLLSSLFGASAINVAPGLFYIGFTTLALFTSLGLFLWISKNTSAESATAGALLWWLLLMAITTVIQPPANYVFMWPLLFTTIGLAFMLTLKVERLGSWSSMSVLSLCAVPGILLFVPVFYLMLLGATLRFSAVVMIFIPLLLGLMIPQLKLLAPLSRGSVHTAPALAMRASTSN